MAIEFHCEHCGKLVRAGSEHAGKRGRCPSCHQSVYIPTPPEEIEPLQLAPVDEHEEREKARLERETRELQRRIREERERPGPDAGPPPASAADHEMLAPKLDMETLVTEYAICMSKGDMETADSLAADIRRNLRAAEDVIQRIISDEIPPAQLARIPRPVLVGFFKKLRETK